MCAHKEQEQDRKLEEKEGRGWRGGGEEPLEHRTLKTAPGKQAMRIRESKNMNFNS